MIEQYTYNDNKYDRSNNNDISFFTLNWNDIFNINHDEMDNTRFLCTFCWIMFVYCFILDPLYIVFVTFIIVWNTFKRRSIHLSLNNFELICTQDIRRCCTYCNCNCNCNCNCKCCIWGNSIVDDNNDNSENNDNNNNNNNNSSNVMDPHLFIDNYDYCVSMLDLNHDSARKVSRVVGASLFDVNDPNKNKYDTKKNDNVGAISRVSIGSNDNNDDTILNKRVSKIRTYSYPQPPQFESNGNIYVPED